MITILSIFSNELSEKTEGFTENSVTLSATLFTPDGSGAIGKATDLDILTTVSLGYRYQRDQFDTSGNTFGVSKSFLYFS